jgi:hypothetical protein
LSRGGGKRRLRVRRKHRDGTIADDAADAVGAVGPEVVAEFGCCAIEAVGGLSILIGLLLVPTYLLLS